MATISIDVPNEALPRVREAFLKTFGYSATLEDGSPNPETPTQFTRRMISQYVKEVTKTYEADLAANQARTTKQQEIETIQIV